MRLRFRLVNVFAESPLAGNALCVIEDGSGLDDATMQAVALQTNLSETTFLLPPRAPGATARVRIFTPGYEMPFAGHPTLGTAHVVRALTACGDAVSLEMKAGVIPVSARGDTWTLAANAPVWNPPGATREELATMLGLATDDVRQGALWVDTGSEQLVIPLASVDAVERCRPRVESLLKFSVGSKRKGMAYVFASEDEHTVRVRFFFEQRGGVLEDPGTGSACANLGGWFLAQGSPLPLERRVSQGDALGRPCRLGLRVDATKQIFVSGRVVEIGRGEFEL